MSDAPASKKILQYGLTEVYSAENAEVELVGNPLDFSIAHF
jgi:hypothetical protein